MAADGIDWVTSQGGRHIAASCGRKGVADILVPQRVPPSVVNLNVCKHGGEDTDEGAGPVDRPVDGVQTAGGEPSQNALREGETGVFLRVSRLFTGLPAAFPIH